MIYDQPVKSNRSDLIPHFLLNDVVRYWRTMASDYAWKMWEREREGWAIRNVKLRFSRKLLFASGLLASLSGELFERDRFAAISDQNERFTLLAEFIRQQADVAPLELLARVALQIDSPATVSKIFSSYDFFLGRLSDSEVRQRLENLPFEESDGDEVFRELHEVSRRYRDGINALFFDEHPLLKTLIRRYGVF